MNEESTSTQPGSSMVPGTQPALEYSLTRKWKCCQWLGKTPFTVSSDQNLVLENSSIRHSIHVLMVHHVSAHHSLGTNQRHLVRFLDKTLPWGLTKTHSQLIGICEGHIIWSEGHLPQSWSSGACTKLLLVVDSSLTPALDPNRSKEET